MIRALVLCLALAACGGSAHECKSAETTAAAADPNKALVAKFVDEVWGKNNPDAISKYVAPDVVNHAAIPEAQGARGLETIFRKVLAAYPDLKMQPVGISSEGDTVVVRATFEGTQTGDLDFKRRLPASGKHVKIDQIHTFRVKDGRIVEAWMVMDHLELLTQLGVMPKPGP